MGPNEEVEVDEAKGEFEVKYASSKKGPIKVSKFNTLDDAKKFLAQVKGEGMNGIISKGGKPVKEAVEFDAKKMEALAKKDKMIAKMMKKGSAKAVFNSEVLGDSAMEKKYQAEEVEINEVDG